jgi:uncharacterized protein (DUF2141 family)
MANAAKRAAGIRAWLKRGALLLFSPIAVMLAGGQALAADIRVRIDGLHSDKGNVVVALFNKPDEFPDGDHSIRHAKIAASLQPITIVFRDLPPGTYAVGAYHDENANNRFDTNFIGYPIEGYALSRGVRAIISRPRFIDASFVVGPEGKGVRLHIEY